MNERTQRLLLVVFILAFILRLGAYVAFNTYFFEGQFRNLDSVAYDANGWKYAQEWRAGNFENIVPRRGNAYPWFVASVYFLVGHHPFVVEFFNILFGSFLVIVLFFIAQRLFDKKTAIIVALLTAIDPSMMFWSTQFLKDILAIFFLACAFYFFYNRKQTKINIVLVALSVFLAGMIRIFIPLFIVPALIIGYPFFRKLSQKENKRYWVVLSFLLLIVLSYFVVVPFFRIFVLHEGGYRPPEDSGDVFSFLQHIRSGQAVGRTTYLPNEDISTARGLLLFFPRGLVRFFLEPIPWKAKTVEERIFSVAQIYWYILLVCSIFGIIMTAKKFRTLTPPYLYVLAVAFFYAIIAANVGTLVRWRMQFSFILLVFAGVGIQNFVRRQIHPKQMLSNYTKLIYKRVMKEEMGIHVKQFTKDLQWVFIGTLIFGGLAFLANIAIGRIIGPFEYGKYNLILSLMYLLTIPMILGFSTSSVKYLAEGKNKKKILSSAFYTVLFLTLICSLIFYFSRNFFSNILGISASLFTYALLIGIFYVFYILFESFLRGLKWMKKLSVLRITSALTSIVTLAVIFLLTKNKTFLLPFIYVSSGYAIYAIISFFLIKRFIARFDKKSFLKIHKYAIYAALGGLFGALVLHADKFLINKYLGTAQAGLYYAYLLAFGIVVKGTDIFLTVFFPTVASIANKRKILLILNRFFSKIFPFLFGFCMALTFVTLLLFGKNYALNFYFIFLFGLYAALYFMANILWWFLASLSKRSILTTSLNTGMVAVGTIVLNIVLIPVIGLYAPIIIAIGGTLYMIVIAEYLLRKNVRKINH